MTSIKLPFQFQPRHFQRDLYRAFFIDHKKRMIQILHRRAGKTKAALNLLIGAAMQRPGIYYHCFPQLTMARRNVWFNVDSEGRRYLDHIPRQLIKGQPNNSEMRVDLINGSQIQLMGADHYDRLRGSNPLGLIFDEFAHSSPYAWFYTAPILRENDGWALFVMTPNSYNHGWDLYVNNINNPSWFVQKLDITQTFNDDGSRIITEEDVEEERRGGLPEAAIRQEFLCDFQAASIGAYYEKELHQAGDEKRIRDFEIDPRLKLFTGWDLGIRDAMAIWFIQVNGHEIRFIHYYENRNESLKHYTDYVHEFVQKHNLKHGIHFAPHDVEVRELSSGKSRKEMAFRLGIPFHLAPKLPVSDAIDAIRMSFSRFWFHETNCRTGLNLLKQYREGDNGKPLHDFSSHCADALRTFWSAWQQSYARPTPRQPGEMPGFDPLDV